MSRRPWTFWIEDADGKKLHECYTAEAAMWVLQPEVEREAKLTEQRHTSSLLSHQRRIATLESENARLRSDSTDQGVLDELEEFISDRRPVR